MTKLTQKRLKELLHYDPDTGRFTWLQITSTRVKVGSVAGTRHTGTGYIYIGVDGKRYKAHRLAWLYVYGAFPSIVDHKNLDGFDNRIDNLRECTQAQNACNTKIRSHNSCGLKGVTIQSNKKGWKAEIRLNHKRFHLGVFDTKEEAHEAYCAAAQTLHGEFARFQ